MRRFYRHEISALMVVFVVTIVFSGISAKCYSAETSIAGNTIYGDIPYNPQLDTLFKQAMKKRDAGDIEGAIEDFKAVLTQEPGLHRARLELAVAYYMLGRYEDAINEAKTVLNDQNIPPNVKVTILAFISQVQGEAQTAASRHNWRFPIEFGYIYDTNVNAGPSAFVIEDIGLRPEESAQSDAGIVVDAGIDHSYQTGKNLNIFGKKAALLWQSSLSGYYRAYFREHRSNFSDYSIRTGPTLVALRSWFANVSFQYDFLRYGEKDLAHYFFVLPSFTWHATDAIEISCDLELNKRDFIHAEEEGRDSIYTLGRISAGYTSPRRTITLQVGAELFNEDAEDNQYSNFGNTVFMTTNWRFAVRSHIFGTIWRQVSKYQDEPPGFSEARDEKEWRFVLGINHRFKDLGPLSDWTLEGKVVYTNLNSNLTLYEYDRTETLITLSKTF